MNYNFEEILETIKMTEIEHFDIRTVTLGISLRDCIDRNVEVSKQKIYDTIHNPAVRQSSKMGECTYNTRSSFFLHSPLGKGKTTFFPLHPFSFCE